MNPLTEALRVYKTGKMGYAPASPVYLTESMSPPSGVSTIDIYAEYRFEAAFRLNHMITHEAAQDKFAMGAIREISARELTNAIYGDIVDSLYKILPELYSSGRKDIAAKIANIIDEIRQC